MHYNKSGLLLASHSDWRKEGSFRIVMPWVLSSANKELRACWGGFWGVPSTMGFGNEPIRRFDGWSVNDMHHSMTLSWWLSLRGVVGGVDQEALLYTNWASNLPDKDEWRTCSIWLLMALSLPIFQKWEIHVACITDNYIEWENSRQIICFIWDFSQIMCSRCVEI